MKGVSSCYLKPPKSFLQAIDDLREPPLSAVLKESRLLFTLRRSSLMNIAATRDIDIMPMNCRQNEKVDEFPTFFHYPADELPASKYRSMNFRPSQIDELPINSTDEFPFHARSKNYRPYQIDEFPIISADDFPASKCFLSCVFLVRWADAAGWCQERRRHELEWSLSASAFSATRALHHTFFYVTPGKTPTD